MSLVVLLAAFVLTVIFPIIALPINLIGVVFARGKIRKCYGALLALSLAFLAFIWVPGESADLYRHHQQVRMMTGYDTSQLLKFIAKNLEPAHYLIKFFVAQTGKYDLLQFLVVFCGYFELFWLICDLAEEKKVKRGLFCIILFYAFVSVRFIDFASGLWCNFSIINIALGVYLGYFKKKKVAQYLLYAFAACLHIGTLYIIIPALLFGRMKVFSKTRLSLMAMIFAVAFLFGWILVLINNLFGADSTFVRMINGMYDSYFVNDEKFGTLHTGWNLILPMINMVICFMLALIQNKNDKIKEYGNFVLYLAIYIFATTLNAAVFARFGFLAAILALPLIVEFARSEIDKRLRVALMMGIVLMIPIQLSRSFIQMESSGLVRQISNKSTSSMFYIMD